MKLILLKEVLREAVDLEEVLLGDVLPKGWKQRSEVIDARANGGGAAWRKQDGRNAKEGQIEESGSNNSRQRANHYHLLPLSTSSYTDTRTHTAAIHNHQSWHGMGRI